MSSQDRSQDHDDLLGVQSLDLEARRLVHRREHLVQRARLAEAAAQAQHLGAEIESLGAVRLKTAQRAKRLEDEASLMSDRADADEVRLYSGELQGASELQALQREIAGLRGRQGGLEDRALEAMAEGEEIAVRIGALEAEGSALSRRISELSDELAAAETEIDERLSECASERAESAGRLDEDLLARYEQLKAWMGDDFAGDAVVTFAGTNCVGCPSTMPAVEADRINLEPAGSVHSCDECGRIVLR